MEWRPCIIKNKLTGQSVHVTIIDRDLYLSGFWSFDDLIELYDEDTEMLKKHTQKVGVEA